MFLCRFGLVWLLGGGGEAGGMRDEEWGNRGLRTEVGC